ncbi:hypothetical protein XA68_16487 [Ophiocordyceps unilateralis]|uniref:Uncharacterized protein n=1 Tax=Ophiocordyceps unilateralis TaxID=268505 RepID=A0A2A9P4T7_OPHUN|nr:hypothetical protein XA68_16487 [Ophiocordyceps unilateralis]
MVSDPSPRGVDDDCLRHGLVSLSDAFRAIRLGHWHSAEIRSVVTPFANIRTGRGASNCVTTISSLPRSLIETIREHGADVSPTPLPDAEIPQGGHDGSRSVSLDGGQGRAARLGQNRFGFGMGVAVVTTIGSGTRSRCLSWVFTTPTTLFLIPPILRSRIL